MATYETEEEQVEALKKWWKENGLSIFLGVLIGFGLLGGWRYWQTHTEQEALIASTMYEQVLLSLEQDDMMQARQISGQLLSQHSNSPYALFAALNMAHKDFENEDIESSHARLQWVIENSSLPELVHIARLRKARILLSQDKLVATTTLITGVEVGTFGGAYAEIQGDIALAQARSEAARSAYTQAIPLLSGQHAEWVQMKLDNLGVKKADRIEAKIPAFQTTETLISVETTMPEGLVIETITPEVAVPVVATPKPEVIIPITDTTEPQIVVPFIETTPQEMTIPLD